MPPTSGALDSSPNVSKEVLEKVVQCKILEYTVDEGSKPGDNYMSVLYSVSAKLIPPGETEPETRHYLLKCYPRHTSRQQFLTKSNTFHNELSFYTDWGKELVEFQTRVAGIPKDKVFHPAFPPCAGGNVIDFTKSDPEACTKAYDPTDIFIMMTDLRKTWGFTMANRLEGLGYDHVRLAVFEYATLHALSWAYRNKVEWDLPKKYPFLSTPFAEESKMMWMSIVIKNVDLAIEAFDSMLGKDNHLSSATRQFQKFTEKLMCAFIELKEEEDASWWEYHRDPPKVLRDAAADDEAWRVVGHGDAWCNNMLFKFDETSGKPERVCFVDFQLALFACPTADLVYMVYTSTTQDFRRKYMDEMLDVYHDRFNEVCHTLSVKTLPGFSRESLKRRFHRSKPFGMLAAVIGLPLMVQENAEEMNLDETDQNVELEEMFKEAFAKGGVGKVYKERLLGVAQDMFEQGVI